MVLAAAIAGTLSILAGPGDDLFPAFEGRARITLDEGDPWKKNAFTYVVPVAEIVAFEVLLNLYDRTSVDRDVYGVTMDSVRDGASEIDANYRTFSKSSVLRGILGFTVSFLGDSKFGAVDWRGE